MKMIKLDTLHKFSSVIDFLCDMLHINTCSEID